MGCSTAHGIQLKRRKHLTVTRVTKLSNPRRRKRANPRRMSLKQKLHFGTKRQRNAAKSALHRKRSNPRKRRTVAHRVKRRKVNPRRFARRGTGRVRRRRRSNPAHILHLGLLNPRPSTGRKIKRRKRNTMAAHKTRRRRRTRSSNPRRRRRNSVKVIVRRRRRSSANPRSNVRRRVRRVRRHYGAKRNPSLFGHSVTALELAKAVTAGLAGVAITKAVPNMLPASIAASSTFTSSIVSVVVAIGSGMLVNAVQKDPMLGYAVGFGGLMQAGSVMFNAFLPSVGTYIGLQGLGNGLGDIVPGRFPVPQNPIMAGQALLPAPAVTPAAAHAMSGVGAIYNPFGRAM